MKYQDVQMVTSSLDRLGDSLLRNRMMQEQQKARGEDRELRDRDFALRERDLTERGEDRKESTAMRKSLLENQQTQQALGELQKAYDSISRDYGSGVIDRGEANRRAKALVDKIKSAPEFILSNSPFAAMLDSDSDLFQDMPGKPEPALTPSNLPGFDGALTPGGHYVAPDKGKPTSFDTIDYRLLSKKLEDAMLEEQAAAQALKGFTPAQGGTFRNRNPGPKNDAAMERLQEAYTQAATRRQAIEDQMKQIRGGGQRPGGVPAAGGQKTSEQLLNQARKALLLKADPKEVARLFKEQTGEDLDLE